jgi:hypothetical protein
MHYSIIRVGLFVISTGSRTLQEFPPCGMYAKAKRLNPKLSGFPTCDDIPKEVKLSNMWRYS